MARSWILLAGVWVGLVGGNGTLAPAQDVGAGTSANAGKSAAAAAPVKKTCMVNSVAPSPAETALSRKEYSSAESLFRAVLAKSPTSDPVHEGLVRALIEQNKVTDAAKDAEAWVTAEPGNSLALVALGDVRLRQGDPSEAYGQFQLALKADLCDARAYYGIAEVDRLAGLHASGRRLIDQAYGLHPTDDDIHTVWISTRQRKERLQKWADYAEHSDLIDDEDKANLKMRLEKESLYHTSDCRMAAASPREATVPMVAVTDGPYRFLGWGLNVKFNGRQRRLQIDTGASGITISRAAAMFLGIKREDATLTGGIGDKGKVKTSITHVASIKIGGMEFTNCPVEILEKWSVLDSDGLIGGDVFDDSQLTLDFPKHELRVAPLPDRPGEKKTTQSLDTAGDDEIVEAHDPYIAPEMSKWLHIYRSGHELLIPGGIVETKRVKDMNAWKNTLFLLDTGADSNLISPAAAALVTKVSRDSYVDIRGVSGQVNKVFEAGKFTLAFGNLRLDSPSMTSIDITDISHGAGVEVSGLIGAPALFQVVMHIDYRDNLVWCEYTAKQ